MSKKGIIVSGGSIHKGFGLQLIEDVQPDYIIGVDSGLSFLYDNQILPTHIVGDFDSVNPKVIAYYKTETKVPIREFQPEKDATDTEIALRLLIELGVDKLWILGGTGSRLDHVMSNIQILKIALNHGIKAWLMDECNRISLCEKEIRLTKEESFGTYFSIFPFDGSVEDVSIEGAKYPLEHYRLTPYESRCVSNELLDGETRITFSKGTIILMETRD